MQLVQTYDAGVTVDQWATLLPRGARRARVPPRVRGLRALVGARASLPARAERDPPAANWCTSTSRATTSAFRTRRRASIRTRPELRAAPGVLAARADRLRVCADLAREPRRRRCPSAGRRTTTTSRRGSSRRSRPGATAICSRRASSTGAATCTASRRCSSAICPTSAPRAQPAHAAGWTPERYDAAKALILAHPRCARRASCCRSASGRIAR